MAGSKRKPRGGSRARSRADLKTEALHAVDYYLDEFRRCLNRDRGERPDHAPAVDAIMDVPCEDGTCYYVGEERAALSVKVKEALSGVTGPTLSEVRYQAIRDAADRLVEKFQGTAAPATALIMELRKLANNERVKRI